MGSGMDMGSSIIHVFTFKYREISYCKRCCLKA